MLTRRVAYLLSQGLRPFEILVTTFTRKAANEMRERLAELGVDVSQLRVGTFHSVCIRLLRRNATAVGLDQRFSVANNKDVNDTIDAAIESLEKELDSSPQDGRLRDEKGKLSTPLVKKWISHLKSKAIDLETYALQKDRKEDLLRLYAEYSKRMSRQSMLDFDDILLVCLKLLRQEQCLKHVKHVLIDEFQDTNSIQLQLMREFAKQNNNVTIVGDVDQSIYAFRGAMAENFQLMSHMYPQCRTIYLKQNYRSTQGILDVSELIMKDQPNRQPKALTSQHKTCFKSVYKHFEADHLEAQFISKEIRHLLRLKVYTASDICILVRSNYMTRIIERSLRMERVSYSILKGRAFWERKEVALVIDLLRITVRQNDRCAMLRVLGESGGIGSTSIKRIGAIMEELTEMTPEQVGYAIVDGKVKVERMQNKAIETCAAVLKGIRDAKALYHFGQDDRDAALELFDNLILNTSIQRLTLEDEEKRDNVMEIRRHLEVFIAEDEEVELTLLEHFLNSIDIYTPEEVAQDGELAAPQPTEQIQISTIHSAKGLEWPVVFVTGLIHGKFPSNKVDPMTGGTVEKWSEERRVLYVAMTRAKQMLYVSSAFEPSKLIARLANSPLCGARQLALSSVTAMAELSAHNAKCVIAGADELVKEYSLLHRTDERSDNESRNIEPARTMDNRVRFAGGDKVPQGFKLGLRREEGPVVLTKTHVPVKVRRVERSTAAAAPVAPADGNVPDLHKKRKTLGMRRRRE